jgi:hypothetical protein
MTEQWCSNPPIFLLLQVGTLSKKKKKTFSYQLFFYLKIQFLKENQDGYLIFSLYQNKNFVPSK